MPDAIRRLADRDCLQELTALLHRAYAPLAAAGMRFLASYQDVKTTAERCAEGECFVADRDGRIVGTIVLRPGPSDSPECAWYRRQDVAVFGQFAVEPSLQRAGIGARLLEHVERRATESGFAELACDTSELADHLIRYYEKRGYRRVGRVRWDPKVVNYHSVVLSKELRARA